MITRSQTKSQKPSIQKTNHPIKDCRVVVEKLDIQKQNNSKNIPSKANNNQHIQCKVVLTDILKDPIARPAVCSSSTRFSKCNFARCQLKNHFLLTDEFKSSCTMRSYKAVLPRGTDKLTCHSSNLVYLLTCSNCGLQYVGETAQQLNARFNGHRVGMKNPKKYGTCKILSNHFNKGVCKGSNYSVQIIEKFEGSGRTEDDAIDPKVTSRRRKREDFWMRTLRTVHPYGLNDRVGDDFMRDQATDKIGLKFFPLKRSFDRGTRRAKRTGNNKFNEEGFLRNLEDMLIHDIKNTMNYIRTSLTCLKKSELKRLGDRVTDILSAKPLDFPYSQWYSVILDMLDCRLYKPQPEKKKRPPKSNFIRVHFCNKGVEAVNLSSILHQSEVLEAVPSVAKPFKIPTVVYTLDPPTGSKIFNFNKFVSSLDVDRFLQDPTSLPCSCSNSPFVDKHHGHIVSGDLRLIENNRLRKLFAKGPKYRERKLVNWRLTEEKLTNAVKEYAQSWCDKHKVSIQVLTPWICVVSEKIRSRISAMKEKKPYDSDKQVLKSTDCMRALEDIHNRFVVVPIDKASSNIALVCKRFYAQVLVSELGLDNAKICSTYAKINCSAQEIIDKDCETLNKTFNLAVSEDSKKLPHIYWTPKLHKNPLKFRFIIAAPNCSIKPLSKAITKIFRLFYRQVETYNAKSFFYSQVKTFWVIQNNEHVINSIKKLNKKGSVRSMSTFDFSTLYTKIPHEKLLEVMSSITDFCFQGGSHELISFSLSSKSNARWVANSSRAAIKFSKPMVKEALEYLMNNCFFTFGNKIFRQIIGIPMGSDPAPFMANLFLYHYENIWMKRLKKDDLQKARRFSRTFRFIDDLLTINDDNLFNDNFGDIYPKELQLNLESSGESVNFLDINLKNINGHVDVKLYDKRDNFPFSIVRLPFSSSNIPSAIFYNCVGAEILRIGRVSSTLENFEIAAKELLIRALNQGGKRVKLERVLKRVYGRQQVLRVFHSNAKKFSDSLLETTLK